MTIWKTGLCKDTLKIMVGMKTNLSTLQHHSTARYTGLRYLKETQHSLQNWRMESDFKITFTIEKVAQKLGIFTIQETSSILKTVGKQAFWSLLLDIKTFYWEVDKKRKGEREGEGEIERTRKKENITHHYTTIQLLKIRNWNTERSTGLPRTTHKACATVTARKINVIHLQVHNSC